MKSQISFTTDIFESKNAKPFGKDLAAWLVDACGGNDLIQNVLRDKPHIREIRWTDQVGHFAR